MSITDLLGHAVALEVQRRQGRQVWLGAVDGSHSPIAMPASELPEGVEDGHVLEVFVYLDSEDQPTATTRVPHLRLNEVAFLKVTDLTKFGAFVDWGLPKELLVPFAEQTRELAVGDMEPVGLMLDTSGRLAGTMRVAELLRGRGAFQHNQWVTGQAWRSDPNIGLFVILQGRFVGLLPRDEPHHLGRGDVASFRVSQVLPDGKVELSLRGLAMDELENDARRVLAELVRAGARSVTDREDPDVIRARFGLSKKAFKRAVGRLLSTRQVTIDAQGFIQPTNAP